jgi:two-component system sensor histidine kinase/response regulator
LRDRIEKRLDELRESMNLALPHEFRTPLTGILGFAEMLEEAQGYSAEETVYIGSQIHRSALRLHKLVERMLLLSELDSYMASPEKRKILGKSSAAVDLAVIQAIDVQGAEFQREEDIQYSPFEVQAAISEAHLSRVVEEVLSNALKFSDKGSTVEVTVSRDAGCVVLSIHDLGRGMSQEQIRSIGAFVQFDRVRHEQQGSGLGLAIVKRICDLYGGSLSISSSESEGTIVKISVPGAE